MVHFLRKWFVDRVTLRKACSFNDETEAKWKKAENNRTNDIINLQRLVLFFSF